MSYIGIDDTDVIDSPGTGHLGRLIAETLSTDFSVLGVTRHQLLFDPRIPYTAKNSCAAVHVEAQEVYIPAIEHRGEKILKENFETGSDPGLAIAGTIPQEIIDFGKQAKTSILNQELAGSVAKVVLFVEKSGDHWLPLKID